jgi:hypothetical protein
MSDKLTPVVTPEVGDKLARLINSCTVWATAVRDEMAITATLDPDSDECTQSNEKVELYMRWHDEYATLLNDMLGTSAVVLYNRN